MGDSRTFGLRADYVTEGLKRMIEVIGLASAVGRALGVGNDASLGLSVLRFNELCDGSVPFLMRHVATRCTCAGPDEGVGSSFAHQRCRNSCLS